MIPKLCVRAYTSACAKEMEREYDIGAADLNIEHARNISRRNLSRYEECEKEKERWERERGREKYSEKMRVTAC